MDIIELLNEAVDKHTSKVKAAEALGIRRQTLDHWIHGLYVPDPWDHAADIARFLKDAGIRIDEAQVVLLLLEKKGVSRDLLRQVGRRAAHPPVATRSKGVYVSSFQGALSQPRVLVAG